MFSFRRNNGGRAAVMLREVLFAAAVAACATLPVAHAAGVPGQGTWETDLVGRDLDGNLAGGYEAYYDKALNITWLVDANFVKRTGYDADGQMDWSSAINWVANLNVHGVKGWRLPKMHDTGSVGCDWAYSGTDCGYNVNTEVSELAHMFYVTLGNKAYSDAQGNGPQVGYGLSNSGPFKDVQSFYWFGQQDESRHSVAWVFNNKYGLQGSDGMTNGFHAWAVHAGDVGTVPEPQSIGLALAGLGVALVAMRRRTG